MAGRGPAGPRRPPSGRRPARRRSAGSAWGRAPRPRPDARPGPGARRERRADRRACASGLGGAAAGPVGLGRALGQPVSRRRLGGVGGVGPQPGLQLDDLRVELADARLEGGDDRVPGDDLGPQPGDGGHSRRVRRSRRRIVRHADAARVPALLVRRARPWQAETRTAPSSGSTQPCCARKAFSQDNDQVRRCGSEAATPTAMWLLQTLHGPVLQPPHRGLTAARGRSTTNQTARAGAATG